LAEPGTIVVGTALDSQPHFLVVNTDADGVEAVLLADLAQESIQRLRHGHTETVTEGARRTDGIDTYRVPYEEIAPSPVLESKEVSRESG